MDKNKNKILNVIIIILAIALIAVIVEFAKPKKEEVITYEASLRDKIRDNITYDYITKPEEEQNAMMAEQERIQNEEMKNEELRQQEEQANEMASEIQHGVSI